MTKRTRTIIFFICLTLFVLGGPSAILYSQGYRLNIGAKEGENFLTQTGGVFIKAAPRQVEIYVDGKLKEKTDFLFGSALVENLLPGKYEIEVRKDDYQSWTKTLVVKEKEVAEAKNIILFPTKVNFATSLENVEQIWNTPSQNILIKENTDDGWVLSFYRPDNQTKRELFKETDINKNGADLIDIDFSTTTSNTIIGFTIGKVNKYFEFNHQDTEIEFTETEKPQKETNYQFGNYDFKLESESLYFKKIEEEDFQKLSDSVLKIKLSPDNQKILYFTPHEISAFFLEDNITPRKKEGETALLMRLTENINDCVWLNSNYLIFTTKDSINIIELDNRDSVNMVSFKEIKNPSIAWNEAEKTLYYLSENTLYVSDVLIP